jgi:nitrate/nitrite transporter NarK
VLAGGVAVRTVGQFVGVLLLVGFVGAYFWWVVAILAVVALAWMTLRAFREIEAMEVAEARRQAAIVKRADQQHAWVLAGDERGIYGRHDPSGEAEPQG